MYAVRKVNRTDSVAEEFEAERHLPTSWANSATRRISNWGQQGATKQGATSGGAKELKAVQQLLRHYRRDHEVLLLPLGGGELINAGTEVELAEMQRIAVKTFALIDSDRVEAGAPLSERHRALVAICAKLEISCHVLERRAFENYFPTRAVKRALGEDHEGFGPFDALDDVPRRWPKSRNWRIAREMTRDELDETDLGEFLRSF